MRNLLCHSSTESFSSYGPLQLSVFRVSSLFPISLTPRISWLTIRVEDPANPGAPATWWFGGGTDLTPSYIFPEDAIHFHSTQKRALDHHSPAYYPRFKSWCDDYFRIKHRGNEMRGIGGIFFDDLGNENGRTQNEVFALARTCGEAFIAAYEPIIRQRLGMLFGDREKRWQGIRRVRFTLCAH